ncbi:MAG: hypothetical protein Kow0054_01630 [Deferrisoma sp.]
MAEQPEIGKRTLEQGRRPVRGPQRRAQGGLSGACVEEFRLRRREFVPKSRKPRRGQPPEHREGQQGAGEEREDEAAFGS